MDLSVSRWPEKDPYLTYRPRITYLQVKLRVVFGPFHLSLGLSTSPVRRIVWANSREDRVWARLYLRYDEFGLAFHPTIGFKWKREVHEDDKSN